MGAKLNQRPEGGYTARELYAMETDGVERDLSILGGCYYNFVEEMFAHDMSRWYAIDWSKNTRAEIRYIKWFQFDARRFWALGTVWFDGKPFMIVQNAGREGDDHASRFVTDRAVFYEFLVYLNSIVPVMEGEAEDELDLDVRHEFFDTFYGDTLHGEFFIYE